MANVISCRASVYGGADEAFELLPQAGIRAVEIGVPEGLDFDPIASLARGHGVAITTVATGVPLGKPEAVEHFRKVMQAVARLGTKRIFISAGGDASMQRKDLLGGLRALAEEAKSLGLILCMETHPPFGTNGTEAKKTIEEVASEGLRYNFDTANIYYYNRGTDSVAELKRVAQYVQSVHLKDTDGGFESPNFPVLGQGVVDFPKVFEILGKAGFTGPYTLELEGPLTEGKSLPEIHQSVKACMDYLRQIGAA